MKPPDPIALPPHAYVPGQNARHDPAVFSKLHASVQSGMDTEALRQSAAWRAGWHYIEHGYFWEAHEALEPVWMALPPDAPERRFVQAVIQTANAALKLKMRRPGATLRLCDMAGELLDACDGRDAIMGLPLSDVRRYLADLRGRAILQVRQVE